jgi:hypothetical protein
MYCLDCAKLGAKAAPLTSGDPEETLRALLRLAERGDVTARRIFFGVLWDEGRSILCYRCKRGRPVRLAPALRDALAADAEAHPGAARTPTTAVGEKAAEGLPPPAEAPVPPPATEHRRAA